MSPLSSPRAGDDTSLPVPDPCGGTTWEMFQLRCSATTDRNPAAPAANWLKFAPTTGLILLRRIRFTFFGMEPAQWDRRTPRPSPNFKRKIWDNDIQRPTPTHLHGRQAHQGRSPLFGTT
jgi:hypothetical protein